MTQIVSPHSENRHLVRRSGLDRFVTLAGITFLLSVISGLVVARISSATMVFLIAPGAVIFGLCALDEWLSPGFVDCGLTAALSRGSVRGAVLGVGGWLGTGLFVPAFTEVAGEFVGLVVLGIPAAVGYGAVAGGIIRFASRKWRRVKGCSAGNVAQPSRRLR